MDKRKRIGLLGGSFNPAHSGHIYISEQALSALNLDEIWWLVNPLNPFKNAKDMLPFDQRLNYASRLNKNPKIKVSDLENKIGTRHTFDTLKYITEHYPDIDFVWLMGDDLLPDFHLWNGWDKIVEMVEIAVFPRSLTEKELGSAPVVRLLKQQGKWNYINMTPVSVSASEIREHMKGIINDKNC